MEEVLTLNKERLEELEGVIEKNLQSFYEIGKALKEIKDNGLYLYKNGGQYDLFEAYCKDVWDFSGRYARALMASSLVIENIGIGTIVPVTETQARPLVKFNNDPNKQREVWAEVLKTASDGKITAQLVTKIAKEYTEKESIPEKPQEISEEKETGVQSEEPEVQPEESESPKKPRQEKKKEFIPGSAAHFIDIAISQLEQIPDDDPMREEELDRLIGWINKKREAKKSISIPSNSYGQTDLLSCEAIAGQ